MKTILLAEIKRLLHNKTIFLLLLVGLFFNVMSIALDQNFQDVTPAAYKKLTNTIVGLDSNSQISYLEKELNNLKSLMYSEESGSEEVSCYPKFCESIPEEYMLVRLVLDEVKQTAEYDSFIDDMNQSAQIMETLGLSGYDALYMRKTLETFEKYYHKTLVFTASRGIYQAISFFPTFLFIFVFSMLFTGEIFLKDKENGVEQLLGTMRYGRENLRICKTFVLAMGIVIVQLLFLTENLLIYCGYFYGWGLSGLLALPIQSLFGAQSCALDINIGCFLGLLFLMNFGTCFVISEFALVLSRMITRVKNIFLVLGGLVGIELFLYYGIDSKSIFASLKWINVAAILNPFYVMGNFKLINLCGVPVSYMHIVAVMLIVFGCICAFINVSNLIDTSLHPKRWCLNQKFNVINMPKIHKSFWMHEIYKLLWKDGGLLVLVGTIIFAYMLGSTVKDDGYDIKEAFYRQNIEELTGLYDDEKLLLIEQNIEKLQEEIDTVILTEQQRNNKEKQLEALEQCKNYALYLKEHPGSAFLNYNGIEMDLADYGKNCLIMMISASIVIVGTIAYYNREARNHMYSIANISRLGKKRFAGCKRVLGIIYVFILFGIIYISYYQQICKTIGLNGLEYQANSIPIYTYMPSFISIGGLLLISHIIRLMLLLSVVGLIMILTRTGKTYVEVLATSEMIAVGILTLGFLLCGGSFA